MTPLIAPGPHRIRAKMRHASQRLTGDAMFLDVVERVLEGGIIIDIVDPIEDDDDGDDSEGSSGAPAILAFAPKPPRRKPGPERTHRKAG